MVSLQPTHFLKGAEGEKDSLGSCRPATRPPRFSYLNSDFLGKTCVCVRLFSQVDLFINGSVVLQNIIQDSPKCEKLTQSLKRKELI